MSTADPERNRNCKGISVYQHGFDLATKLRIPAMAMVYHGLIGPPVQHISAFMEQKLLSQDRSRLSGSHDAHPTRVSLACSGAILRENGMCRSSLTLTIILTRTACAIGSLYASIARPTPSLHRASMLADKAAANRRL